MALGFSYFTLSGVMLSSTVKAQKGQVVCETSHPVADRDHTDRPDRFKQETSEPGLLLTPLLAHGFVGRVGRKTFTSSDKRVPSLKRSLYVKQVFF